MNKVKVEMEISNIISLGSVVRQEIERDFPGVLKKYGKQAIPTVDLTTGSSQNMEITDIDFERLKVGEVFKLNFITKEKNPAPYAGGEDHGPFIHNTYVGDFRIKNIEKNITLNFDLPYSVLRASQGGGKRRKSRPKRKKSKRKHR